MIISNEKKIKKEMGLHLYMSLFCKRQLKLNLPIIQRHLNYSYFNYSNPSFNVG